MARGKESGTDKKSKNGANLGLEQTLWQPDDNLLGNCARESPDGRSPVTSEDRRA